MLNNPVRQPANARIAFPSALRNSALTAVKRITRSHLQRRWRFYPRSEEDITPRLHQDLLLPESVTTIPRLR